jgi:hypothetical protein
VRIRRRLVHRLRPTLHQRLESRKKAGQTPKLRRNSKRWYRRLTTLNIDSAGLFAIDKLDCVLRQGIKVEREAERSRLSIKEVLEQKRLNDATGALVKEFFASIPPEKLAGEISRMFHEFDTDGSGGLDQ